LGFLVAKCSGKTTTIRMSLWLIDPHGGSGSLPGYDIFTQILRKFKNKSGLYVRNA